MDTKRELLEMRKRNAVREGLAETGFYHSFRLPDGQHIRGAMSLEWQQERLASFGLPEELRGKRVLDIGPWDGYFTFEIERRGAEVTAIDYVDLDTFRALHRVFRSRAHYERLDVYELDPKRNGTFDIVLCLGVLYHLKHPLLALEKICAVTRDVCIIDTFVADGQEWQQGVRPPLPYIEFYERDELGGQLDNWCGPTVDAVEALARAAGFAHTQVLRVTDTTACIAAHRKWTLLPPEHEPPVEVVGLTCHTHRGRSFQSNKEEYIQLWCLWNGPDAPPLARVYPEVDGYGAPPLSCTATNSGLLINLRVPPGLLPGRHQARVKIGPASWSEHRNFYVDLPPVTSAVQVRAVQDGVSLRTGEVDWSNGGWLTVWLDGLSAEADAGNTIINITGIPHLPEVVDAERGQVNVRLRPIIHSGIHEVRVLHRGMESSPTKLVVVGAPPQIAGLEQLHFE